MEYNDFLLKTQHTLNRFKMIDEGDSVLCALSGGADSVAMLYALKALCEKFNFSLGAAHLNHSIRGDEADRDQRFCQKLCEKLDIPFFSEKRDIPFMAQKERLGLEECARIQRYNFLYGVSEKYNYKKIATAHHSHDNLETILFNIARGCSGHGLHGILPVRDIIIRPLLYCSKEDITRFIDNNNNIEYVTDSTNSDINMSRNRIRHKILPEIFKINPKSDISAQRLSLILKEDNDYILSQAKTIPENANADLLKNLHISLLSRYIQTRYQNFLERKIRSMCNTDSKTGTEVSAQTATIPDLIELDKTRRTQLDYTHINSLATLIKNKTDAFRFSLPGGVSAYFDAEGLSFSMTKSDGNNTAESISPKTLNIGENTIHELDCKILISCDRMVAARWQNIYKLSILTKVKSDRIFIGGALSVNVRQRLPKDSYVFDSHTRLVKKELINAKVPLSKRSKLPFFCCGNELFWVPYLKLSDSYRPGQDDDITYILYTPNSSR